MVPNLIDHFKNGSFENLILGLGDRWQALENQLQAILISRYIANATGETLRNIGLDLGVTQSSTDDETYRVFVYARIGENRSSGSREDVYNVLSLLGLSELKMYDVFPATVTVNYLPSASALTCNCIRAILEASSLQVKYDITTITESPFGFAGDNTASGFGIGQIGGSL